MKKQISAARLLPVLYAAILSTAFFMSLVLLDSMMKKKISLYTRDAISHLVITAVVFAIMIFLPGGPANWGLNLKNWQRGLWLGIISGLGIGILFSLFSFGINLIQWNFSTLMNQLKDRENFIHLLSQVFLIGLSEELLFRGILVTYLMRKYAKKIIGIHLGVIIISISAASLQFYKLLFGASFGEAFPLVFGGFLYALLLGWLYQKTGSLLSSVVTHNLGNSLMALINFGM